MKMNRRPRGSDSRAAVWRREEECWCNSRESRQTSRFLTRKTFESSKPHMIWKERQSGRASGIIPRVSPSPGTPWSSPVRTRIGAYSILLDQGKEKPTTAPEAESIETQPELWLDRYGDLLFRDAMVRLGDRAAASDVVQETLLAALRGVRKGGFDGRVEFHHWLRAILRNKVVDHIRKRVRERPFDLSDPEGIGETLLYKMTGVPTTSPENWAFDLETAFEREEFWAAFEACMSDLVDIQRSVFTMKVLDGVSTEEVCNVFSITSNNMGVVLHRARQALQNCLQGKWFVED